MTSRYINKNASSFNPFDTSSGDQRSLDEIEKQRKKEKQNFYRDQLDQLVHTNQHKKTYERTNNDINNNLPQNSLNIGGVSRNQEQKSRQPPVSDQRKNYQDPYSLGQQKAPNDYEQYQGQGGYENRQNANYNNEYDDYYGQQELRQPQGGYNDLNAQQGKAREDASTFNQQDQQRDQLLSKIKNGYKPQNEEVLNTFKRVHESQERSRQEAERNIIERAAKEKLQREEEQALNQWDQKKKLQREMLLSNQQQIKQKENQKKREIQQEKEADKQRIQDSLYQFEQNNYQQKEKNRRMVEDNNRQIQQQRQDYQVRNQRRNQDDDYSNYSGNQGSVDQIYRGNDDSLASRVLAPKTNQPQYETEQYYDQERQYARQQPSDYDHVTASMDGLSLQQQGGYPSSQQGYDQPQYEYAPPSRQQSQANSVASSSKSDYQRIKDKSKGSGFNIITGS